MGYYVGLDLGQSADYSALAVIQGVKEVDFEEKPEKIKSFLHLRHLERYPLRTPYTEIAEAVADLMRSEQLNGVEYDPSRRRTAKTRSELLVDKTGVGAGVTDLLKAKGLLFTPITIHSGETVSNDKGTYNVPKKDLIAALEVPFDIGTLKVAEGLELWPTLKEELLNFRRKQNRKTNHISFEHWREGDHDDLVLACAMACWGAMARRGLRALRVFR
jgi:hypothetical protein